MRLVMVTVRDAKMDMFMRPWFTVTSAAAERAFRDELTRPSSESQMFKHPEDYSLYEIGLFEEETGKVHPYDVPRLIIQGDQITQGNNLALQKNITAV